MIKVNFSALIHAKLGDHETITLDLDDIPVDDLDLKYLKGKLQCTRVADGILVVGALEAAVRTQCTRCLASFYEAVLVELEDTIILPGAEVTPEHPVRVTENGWADLTPLVREHAWLGMPLNPICSPACKGICPSCGGVIHLGECDCENQEPIDPRWEALRALVDPSEES